MTQYDPHSAGQRNTHYFCYLMNLAGDPSFLILYEPRYNLRFDENRPITNPLWKTPILKGEPTSHDIVIMGDAFTNVYPFKHCKKTVRYFGYLPSTTACGYWGGSRINKKDLVLCHNRNKAEVEQYWGRKVRDDQLFDFPSVERDLFKPLKKTIPYCHYFGKGERTQNNTQNIHLPIASLHIEQNRPATRQGLANILNHTAILFTFDNETALRQEAILAGYMVIYLHHGNQWEQFIDSHAKKLLYNEPKDIQLAHQFVQVCNRFFGKDK